MYQSVWNNMVNDMCAMAEQEAHTKISKERAEWIIREILRGGKENGAIYRITTARLEKLVKQSSNPRTHNKGEK